MMSKKKLNIPMPQLSMQSGKPSRAMPWLVAAAVLLAFWVLWTGWGQWRAASEMEAVKQQRDQAALDVARAVGEAKKRTVAVAAEPIVVGAVESGDLAAMRRALATVAKGAVESDVFRPSLVDAYAGLPTSGYGKLAVVESVIASGKPQVRVVRLAKVTGLATAAPLPDGSVALLVYPVQALKIAMEKADAGNGYLALRQGQVTVAEKGDTSLAGSAEAKAARVAGTDLRIAASLPTVEAGLFGLGAVASLLLGLALLLLAAFALAWPRLRARRDMGEVDMDSPTLEQSMALEDTLPPSTPSQGAHDSHAVPPPLPQASDFLVGAQQHSATDLAPDAGIFRAYDIRGVVGQTLDVDVANLIGQAIGSLMHERGLQHIVVGRDGRLSGPELAGALIDGLRSTGRDVTDIGLAPTPLVYFAAAQEDAGSCVAVTGSHNPPDYNGFKIVIGNETLSGEAITDLHRRIVDGRLHRAEQAGQLETRHMASEYVLRVASDIQLAKPLKVVVDAGNGAAGELGPRVLEAIGAEVIPLFCEIDGTFPNHHPDPSEPHNLEDLRRSVEAHGADLGLAFDGDGDRLGVITPAGANVFPDRLLMLFAADVLDRQPGAVIVYDVKCSGALMPFILRHGGSPLMWKTGHSLIKAKMRETEAELAGEMSGHFFFKERWYGFDDGIYSAARLLEILAGREEDADAVFAEIPDAITTPELKIPVGDPHAFIERFVTGLELEGARAATIDGLRADWPDGWGLVRASNTTPILVLRFEANDEEALTRIQQVFRTRLLEIDPELSIPF